MNTPIRLAFLVDSLLSRYQLKLFKGALRFAHLRGVHLVAFQARLLRAEPFAPPSFDGSFLFDLASSPAVDALIVVANVLSTAAGAEAVRSFCARSKLPVVSVGEVPGIPYVDVDSTTGLQTVIEHVVTDHGRRRLAFVRGSPLNPDSAVRERIFRETVNRLGIPIPEEYVLQGNFHQPSGAQAVRTLFDERRVRPEDVDTIVVSNDPMAAGVIEELTIRRIRVPEDIAVIGFDDDDFARNCSPPLTTVSQPVERLGVRAVELALDRLAGRPVRAKTILGSAPMFRSSCGCRPRHSRPVPPPLTPGSLDLALDECESAAARQLTKLVGARQDAPDVRALTEAIVAPSEVDRRAALSGFERAVLRSAELGVDPLRWENVIAPFAEAIDRFAEAYPSNGERYRRRLLRAQLLVNEVAARTQAISRMHALQHASAIRILGSALVSARSLRSLSRVLETGLASLGVRYCCVCLFVDRAKRTEATVLTHYTSTARGLGDLIAEDGDIWRSFPDTGTPPSSRGPLPFPARALVPSQLAPSGDCGDLLVYPLTFAESPLGYVAFNVPDPLEHAWMLESVAGHLSSAIYSVLAAEELRRARESAARASTSQTELVAKMARELRAPLKDIRTHLEACLQSTLDARARDRLERARQRSDAVLSLVDDLVGKD